MDLLEFQRRLAVLRYTHSFIDRIMLLVNKCIGNVIPVPLLFENLSVLPTVYQKMAGSGSVSNDPDSTKTIENIK